MSKEDILNIQQNAKKLIIETFPKSKFIDNWKNLLIGILK
jgi:hypothetical protein